MAANQATINVAVNVQNLTNVKALSQAFIGLRSAVIAAQMAYAKNLTQLNKAEEVAASTRRKNSESTARIEISNEKKVAVSRAASSREQVDQSRIRRNNTLTQIALDRKESQEKRQIQRDENSANTKRQRQEEALIKLQQRANELNAKHQAQLQEEKQRQAALKATIKDRLAYYEKALDAIFRASYRLKQVGQDLKQFGMGIIEQMKGFTDVFGEFEFMAGRAAGAIGGWAISGQEADKNFRALQDTILANAESLRLFTATDVAKSLYFLASTTGQVVDSQKDLNNMMSALEPIMQTAALTQTDYETTIKGVYSIVAQYNSELLRFSQNSGDYTLMSQEMRKVTVDLFYVAQKTAAEFNDLVNSFKMVGPVAKQSGASFEDILDLLGRLADVGIRGTMAGRALRQMFIQMVKPSGPATAALKELFNSEKNLVEFGGKNYKQLMFPDGQFVGTTKYINILARALQGASQQQKNYLLAKISTANMLPVMQALISQETAIIENGGEALSKTADMNTKAQETFSAAWERLRTSWVGTTSALQRGVEALQIVIGRELANAFTPFIEKVRQIVDALRSWVQANPQLVAEIGKFLGVAAGISVVVGTILSATGAIIGMVAAASLIVGAFGPAVPVIGSLIALVIAFGSALLDRFNEIQTSLQSFASEISRFFSSLVSSSDDGVTALQSIIDMFKLVANQFINIGKTIIDTLTAIVKMINDLGLAVPVIKALGVVLAIAFGRSLLGTFKGLISNIRLFRTETTMTWKVVTTETNGATVSLIAQEAVVNKVGLGYRVLTGIQEAWAASSIRAALASTSFGVAASAAITTIGTTLRAVVSLAFGPIGIIAMFAGMAAYESNFLGIKDAIGGISKVSRNLKEELDGVNSSLGDMSVKAADVIAATKIPGGTKTDNAITQMVQNLIPSDAKEVMTRSGLLNSPEFKKIGYLTAQAFGMQFQVGVEKGTIPFIDEGWHGLDQARADLAKQMQDYRDGVIADNAKILIGIRDELNPLIVAAGGEPIDVNMVFSRLLDVASSQNVDVNKVFEAYRAIVKKYGTKFTPEQAYAEATKVLSGGYSVAGMPMAVSPFVSGTARALVDTIGTPEATAEAIASEFANRKTQTLKDTYQPLIDNLVNAMASGDQAAVVRALTQPIGTFIGGTFIQTGDALASLSPDLKEKLDISQVLSDAVTGLDSNMAAGLDPTLFEGDETSTTLSDLVTIKLQSDFDTAHADIVDKAQVLLENFVNEPIFKGGPLAGAALPLREQYRQIAGVIVDPKTGETVLDYVRNDKSLENVLGTTLGPLYKNIVEQGIQEGWIYAAERVEVKLNPGAAKALAYRISGAAGVKGFGAYLIPSGELTSGIGSSLDKSLSILYPEINKFASDTLDAFALSIKNAKTPQQIKDAYGWLLSQSFNGQTIVDIARSENIDGDIRSGFRQVIEGGAAAGMIDKGTLDAFNASGAEDGKKTWGEYVDAFTSAVESARSFKERLKEALKAGGTGKQIGSLLKTFASRDIRRALKGNLTARGLGISELGISAEGLISSLVAVKPGQQKKFASKIARFFILRGADMPPEARDAFQPVIDFLINNTKISDEQKNALGDILGSAVTTDTPITPEQANSVGTQILSGVATGIQNASSNEDVLSLVRTAHTNLLSTFTAAVDWKAEGINAGKAWAEGLSEGMKTFILGLTVVKDNTEGNSPPKKGPLKNIDKGGIAVGKAYGASLSKGMGSEVKNGLDKVLAMSRTWTGPKGNYRAGRSWTNPLDTLIAGRSWTSPAQNLSPWLMGRSWTGPKRNVIAGRSWTSPMDMLSPWIMGRSWTKGGPTAGRQWTTPAGFGPEKGRSWTNKPNVGPGPQGARTWTGAIALSWDKNSKKQIAIDITVKSDPNTPATAIGEIRRGIMEALTASDLEHMMEIV